MLPQIILERKYTVYGTVGWRFEPVRVQLEIKQHQRVMKQTFFTSKPYKVDTSQKPAATTHCALATKQTAMRSWLLPLPSRSSALSGAFILRVAHPSSATFARAAVFDSNPGQQNTNDKHGTLFHLNPTSGVIVIAEAGYQVSPSADNNGKDEAYTIGGYYDSRTFTGNFIQSTHSSNCGFYAIADCRLYRSTPYINEQSSNAGLGVFASFSVAPPDRNEVSFYIDGGINYTGLFPGRDKDLLGLAVSYTKISNDYVVNNIPIHSGHETVLEATYRFWVNDSLHLQPDFQYIFDPGAFRHLPNTVVIGMRFDLTF